MARYFEGTDMIIGKKYYEVYLRQHVKGSVEDDYMTTDVQPCSNYHEARRIAKDCAKNYYGKEKCPYGDTRVGFLETMELDKGLASAQVVCYTATDFPYESSYQILFREYYDADGTIERFDE